MKKQVSINFFQLIKQRVLDLENELTTLQKESRESLLGGEKSRPELAHEEQLQKTLKEAKNVFRSCEPVPNPLHNNFVQVGSIVQFSFEGSLKILRVEGVGGYKDVCSLESPLGSKLLGATIGAEFMINKQKVKIEKIDF